ncbi:MAG: hypothetical protein AB4042_16055 [Leptolyngbyaceae cyanobacterium]
MKLTQHLRFYVVVSVMLCLSGCGLFASSPPDVTSDETPNASAPSSPSSDEADANEGETDEAEAEEAEPETPVIPVPDDVLAYQDPNGMFALAFPEGYRFEPSAQGVTFLSADGGFAGEVAYQVSERPSNDMLRLEQTLKAHIDPQFSMIEWQKDGQRQPDGSVRLAWTGVDDGDRDIDALSFIEVRGPVIFILSLYAIDQEYNTYGEDARIIAGTYVVRRGGGSGDSEEEEAADSPDADSSEEDPSSEDSSSEDSSSEDSSESPTSENNEE